MANKQKYPLVPYAFFDLADHCGVSKRNRVSVAAVAFE